MHAHPDGGGNVSMPRRGTYRGCSELGAARITRRALLASGGALAAAGASTLAQPLEAQAQGGDASILRSALRLEQTQMVTFEAIAATRALEARSAELLDQLREHERHHYSALAGPLQGLGGSLPEPLGPADIGGLQGPRGDRHGLELALALEERGVAAYHDAVRRLEDGTLIQLAASILASEGQHLALLREALGRDPIPSALESGSASASA